MRGMSLVSKLGMLVAATGAASWLVVAVWHYNFVADIFGSGTQSVTTGERIIYIVFGVGAVVCLPLLAAALGSARSGRRSQAAEERAGQARSDAPTTLQAEGTESQQLVDYREFKEFQAWQADKRTQEASAEAAPAEPGAE
jgi:uncharacterized membrane protein YuzA (DUF378 family)